jgi:hypothetical protein
MRVFGYRLLNERGKKESLVNGINTGGQEHRQHIGLHSLFIVKEISKCENSLSTFNFAITEIVVNFEKYRFIPISKITADTIRYIEKYRYPNCRYDTIPIYRYRRYDTIFFDISTQAYSRR